MTDVENIERLIFRVFGIKKHIRARANTNSCISPLNTKNPGLFAYNFQERLSRICNAFSTNRAALFEIAERVKNIAEAKEWGWAGPYSELVALDFFSQFPALQKISYINRLPVREHTLSVAAQNGRKEIIDIDILLESRQTRIFTDVKSFNSVHLQILDSIFLDIEEFARATLKKSILIGATNLSSVDYSEVKAHLGQQKNKIKEALKSAVSHGERSFDYSDESGLFFRFKIEYSGSLSTVSEYSPYAMAEAYRTKFLDYGEKLLDDEYSVITVVKNPWFNKEVVDFGGFNNIFYRALARRTFLELSKDKSLASSCSRQYANSSLRVCDISRSLAGIFFIDDNSFQSREQRTLYSAYFYLNPVYCIKEPLTVRKLEKSFRGSAQEQIKDFDDFKWDNY